MSTLALNKHTPVNATAGPVPMALPTGAPAGAQVSVEKNDTSRNAVTISGSIRGATASDTLTLPNETIVYRADAAGSWWPYAGHKKKSALSSVFGAFIAALELIKMVAIGHSWIGADINATPGARVHERLFRRLGMGSIVNNGIPGFTIEDLSTVSLNGPRAWTAPQRAFLFLVCTINSLTLFQGSAAARRSYNWAWRALLCRLTANAAIASNTASFSYKGTWTAETITTNALQGASTAATGGTRWKTSTVGDSVDHTFTGDAVTLIFVARAAGAGLVTATIGGATVGTLDLTATAAQDCPAPLVITGAGSGNHTVTCTLTSGASMTVDSALIPSSAPPAGVVLGEFPVIPKVTDYVGYLTDLIAYKADLATIVGGFPSLVFIDLDRPGFDQASMLTDDGKHPNDKGCDWVAGVITSTLERLPFTSGSNVLAASAYPAAYVAPTGPAVPAGGQDGTGNPGITLTPGGSQMALDWSRLAVPVGTTDWSIQYRVSPSGSVTTVAQGSTATTKTITGLTNATAYDFRVASVVSGTVGTYSSWVTGTPILIYATDTFTAADSTTGLAGHTTDTGALTWSVLDASTGATWGIISNQAYWSAGAGNSVAVVDAGHADIRLKYTLNGVPTSNLGGLAARVQDANNYIHAALRGTSGATHYSISKRSAGTLSILADTGVNPTIGDVVQLVVSGSSISLIVNNTTIASATDSSFSTSTRHGFYGSSTGVGGRYDNFAVSAP